MGDGYQSNSGPGLTKILIGADGILEAESLIAIFKSCSEAMGRRSVSGSIYVRVNRFSEQGLNGISEFESTETRGRNPRLEAMVARRY